jgi:hypothetical protein
MKTVMSMGLLVAGAVLAVGAPARAEVIADVKIPFPFVVQHQTMPAGEYTVERDINDPTILLIRDQGKGHGLYVLTSPASGRDPSGDKPALTFKKKDNQYELVDVWRSAADGAEVASSK